MARDALGYQEAKEIDQVSWPKKTSSVQKSIPFSPGYGTCSNEMVRVTFCYYSALFGTFVTICNGFGVTNCNELVLPWINERVDLLKRAFG